MRDTYSCPYVDCGKVFRRAFELRKHEVAHKNPDRVFYCPKCPFITLQKKNLAVHIATHTGEKNHQCPDTIGAVGSVESPTREERCDYRTNDPAALTKHRKKVHGYIPPPNRSRAKKCAPVQAPRKSRKTKDRIVSRQPPLSQCPLPTLCPEPSRAPETLDSCSDARYMFTSPMASKDPHPLLWQDNLDMYRQSMNPYFSNVSGCDSSISSSAVLASLGDEMDLNALYDPSLQPDWLAKYEMSYNMFDLNPLPDLPEPFSVGPSSNATTFETRIDWNGRSFPEWTVATKPEIWDHSAFGPRKQSYAFDA